MDTSTVLMEADFSAFHARMLGREAKDAKYMDLASRDIHSFFGSYIIGQGIPYELLLSNEGEFMERIKRFKKDHKDVRDKEAKPTILGVGFGLQASKLSFMNRETIPTRGKAQKLLDMVKDLFPLVFKFQNEIREKAHYQTYLQNSWNCRRWFYDVYRWDKKTQAYKSGKDSEKAIAYLPASNAFGMIKDVIARLGRIKPTRKLEQWELKHAWDSGIRRLSFLVQCHFINTIHDSLILEPYGRELDYCGTTVQREMERPCVVLADRDVCPSGFSVKAELMWGKNWGGQVVDKVSGLVVGNKEGMREWTSNG